MGAFSCSKWGVSIWIAATVAVAVVAIAAPVAAVASPAYVLSVNGAPLGASSLHGSAVTVAVNAPTGVSVKFKLDGTYLGQDSTAPYTWPIKPGPGSHRMEARWDHGGRQKIKTTFAVSASQVPAAVAPASKSTVSPTNGAPIPPAATLESSILSVDGAKLASSSKSVGRFSVAVNAPHGAKVKFKIDGTYLGQDSTAPYTWPIDTSSGTHEIDARWHGGQVTARFAVSAGAGAASPNLPTPVVPRPAPAPAPVASALPGRVNVSTSAELSAALTAARPGQTIALADGLYVGKFASAASGTASAPIVLAGTREAILSTGNVKFGYGLHLTGSYWQVRDISVTKSGKGIVLDGSTHTTISAVDVGNTGAEGVHFRTNSSDGVIEDSIIHDTGLAKPAYGEGIYVGSAKSNWSSIMGSAAKPDRSDRIVIRHNRISNAAAEGIDVKEGTTGGTIIGNVFSNAGSSGQNFADSWIDMKGNGYRVVGNSGSATKLDAFQVHSVLPAWGRNNVFSGNTVLGGVPGYEVWVQSASLGTTVACKPSGAFRGLSNIACSA